MAATDRRASLADHAAGDGPVLRSLHIDIEGGFGGSSRSLYELLSRMPRDALKPRVLYRERGPMMARYRELGVDAFWVPEIASWIPRQRGNLKIAVGVSPRFRRFRRFLRSLEAHLDEAAIDVVHFNYDGLFLAARALRARTDVPFVFHSRTVIPDNRWGRFAARQIGAVADHVFFISENERDAFERAAGQLPKSYDVLWNISDVADEGARVRWSDRDRYVAYFGAIGIDKGADRLVEIARALERQSAPALRIRVFGSRRHDPRLFDELEATVRREKLDARISFEGHTDSPEALMASALAVLRVSRWNDPWGRDVIEAACKGTPVLATGTYPGVVRDGETGLLFESFEADDFAQVLSGLVHDESRWSAMSQASLVRAREQFSGVRQVSVALNAFKRLVEARTESGGVDSVIDIAKHS